MAIKIDVEINSSFHKEIKIKNSLKKGPIFKSDEKA